MAVCNAWASIKFPITIGTDQAGDWTFNLEKTSTHFDYWGYRRVQCHFLNTFSI